MAGNRGSNGSWSVRNTRKLIKILRNYQLLWPPYIARTRKYQQTMQFAKDRVIRLMGKSWPDIQTKIAALRRSYQNELKRPVNERNWIYHNEMLRSWPTKNETTFSSANMHNASSESFDSQSTKISSHLRDELHEQIKLKVEATDSAQRCTESQANERIDLEDGAGQNEFQTDSNGNEDVISISTDDDDNDENSTAFQKNQNYLNVSREIKQEMMDEETVDDNMASNSNSESRQVIMQSNRVTDGGAAFVNGRLIQAVRPKRVYRAMVTIPGNSNDAVDINSRAKKSIEMQRKVRSENAHDSTETDPATDVPDSIKDIVFRLKQIGSIYGERALHLIASESLSRICTFERNLAQFKIDPDGRQSL